MASTIVTKNSSTASAVPVTGDLTQGELAVNVTDKKLYTKDSGGTVVKLVGGLGNQEANAVAITGGSINGTTVGATTASTGAFTTLSASSTVSGTGFSTYLASPPAIGGTAAAAGSFTTLSASSTTTLSGGTANGVAYLNGSKVVTTGSALTFDGTNLGVLAGSVTSPAAKIHAVGSVRASTGAGTVYSQLASDGVYSTGTDLYLFAPTGYSNIFYANNSEGMRLTSTGLGIGTSSPAYRLDVSATGTTVSSAFRSDQSEMWMMLKDSGTTLGHVRLGSASGAMLFYSGNNTRATIDSSGNLGLGVTPSAYAGQKSLQVANYTGGIGISITASGNDYGRIGYNFGSTNITGSYTYLTTEYASSLKFGAGGFQFYTAPSGTAGTAISFTQAMTLDASGNLLVAATSPIYSSTNRGNITLGGSAGSLLFLGTGSTTGTYLLHTQASGTFEVWNGANGPMLFATNNTERARIDSSGNLLVGKTSLSDSTNGIQLRSDGVYILGATSSGSECLMLNRNTSDGSIALFKRSNTQVGSISVTTTATAYNTSSDYRLKNIDGPLNGSGDFIDALKPKVGTWKSDGSKFVGFLAHEVQEVSPQTVVGEKDAIDEEGNPIMQAMEYGSAEFIANIVAELQSLRQRVAQLEGK